MHGLEYDLLNDSLADFLDRVERDDNYREKVEGMLSRKNKNNEFSELDNYILSIIKMNVYSKTVRFRQKYTVFEYEGNKNERNELIGGLRIKTIKDYSQNDLYPMVRTFEYKNPITNKSSLFIHGDVYTKCRIVPIDSRFAVTKATDHYTCQPSLPLSYTEGSPVLYQEVTEYSGYPDDCTGKTEYHYMHVANDTQFFFNNGDYNINGHYTIRAPWPPEAMISMSLLPPSPRPAKELFQWHDLKAETGIVKLMQTKETNYLDNNEITQSITCFYDRITDGYNHYPISPYEKPNGPTQLYELTSSRQINSDGSIIKKRLKYPYDVLDGISQKMIEKNILSKVIIETDSVDNKFIQEVHNEYRTMSNGMLVPYKTNIRKETGVSETEATYNYDDQMSLLSYIQKDGFEQTFIWGIIKRW